MWESYSSLPTLLELDKVPSSRCLRTQIPGSYPPLSGFPLLASDSFRTCQCHLGTEIKHHGCLHVDRCGAHACLCLSCEMPGKQSQDCACLPISNMRLGCEGPHGFLPQQSPLTHTCQTRLCGRTHTHTHRGLLHSGRAPVFNHRTPGSAHSGGFFHS